MIIKINISTDEIKELAQDKKKKHKHKRKLGDLLDNMHLETSSLIEQYIRNIMLQNSKKIDVSYKGGKS